MAVRFRKIDSNIDRRILTGMIVSTDFLRAIKPIYNSEYLNSQHAVIVAGWCLSHYEKYKQAPGKEIEVIFDTHIRNNQLTKVDQEFIEMLIVSLDDNGEYEHAEKFNVGVVFDQAIELFRQRRAENLTDDIKHYLNNGDITKAEHAISTYKKPQKLIGVGINPIGNKEAYQKAFSSQGEPLFHLPGALGDLLNSQLVRSGFVGLLGRAKIGKTWRLMDLNYRALQERCNTAVFQMGDLTENNFVLRQAVYFGHKSWDSKYCERLIVPELDCLHNQKATCPINRGSLDSVWIDDELDLDMIGTHRTCTRCTKIKNSNFIGTPWFSYREKVTPLTWEEAYKADLKWQKRHHSKHFKLASYSNGSQNVNGICQQLDIWREQEGFVPDVIFIDYPDIMAPEDSRLERRHQEDDRWRALRRLSQDYHCLVIVATQTNRGGFDEETIKATNTSEDKRKLDHVTALFSLNQTEEEEKYGIIRFANTGIIREGRSDRSKQVCVLQSLETGRPYIASYWKVSKKKKEG